MATAEDVDLSWMIGRGIERVYLKSDFWRFDFTDGGGLRVDSLWRVLANGGAAVSSADHGHDVVLPGMADSAEQAEPWFRSRKIKATFVRADSGDLVIELEGNVRLEAIVTSVIYETWKLYSPNGDEVIAIRDGRLVTFRD